MSSQPDILRAPQQLASAAIGAVGGVLRRNGNRTGDGYFPEGTILREVMSERAVGLYYGQRALMIGALWPPPFVGTFEHTGGKQSPFRRLAHTGEVFETIYFGTKAEADEVLAMVRKMHTKVSGEMPEPSGIYAAGTPYDAFDPELMLWTMAVIADSAEYFFELLVRELDDGEREELWQQWVTFAELFGMPRSAAPTTYAAFRAWYEGMLASEKMALTDRARMVGVSVGLEIPFPWPEEIGKPLHDILVRGSLPPRARELYGLSWTPWNRRQFAAVVRFFRTQRLLSPPTVRRGYNTRLFERVLEEERRRIRAGEPTPQYD